MVTSREKFFPQLESLRGIAAVLVVFYHVAWMNPLYDTPLIRNGALMVDLFFVLSGFVMIHVYRQKLTEATNIAPFIISRFWRIYPLHLVFLCVFVCIEFTKYFAEVYYGIHPNTAIFSTNNLPSFINHIFLIHSLGFQEFGSFNNPSWSISTEFYTYILFAILMVAIKGDTNRFFLFLICAASSLVAILLVGKTSLTFDYNYSFFRCTYGFFIGCSAYKVYEVITAHKNILQSKTFRFLVPMILGAILGFVLLIKHDNYIEFSMPPLAAMLIISLVASPNAKASVLLRWFPFQWLGKVSYSIYMVHMSIIWVITSLAQVMLDLENVLSPGGYDVLNTTMGVGLILNFVLVISVLLASYLTHKFIEQPFRRGIVPLLNSRLSATVKAKCSPP